jgi:cytidylate kinase
MNTEISIGRCLSYIDSQLQDSKSGHPACSLKRPPAVTISRETGAGGVSIGGLVADQLQKEAPGSHCPWTVFDRNLVEKVLEDHHLPMRLARYMPEARVSELQNMLEEVLGLHPDAWSLVRQSAETILKLAELGNVILVGRGANIITGRLHNVLHVRLVAPLECRIRTVVAYYRVSEAEAIRFVEEQDRARNGYVKKFFARNIEDPMQYHLVLNTGLLDFEEAARIIAGTVLHRFY